MQACPESDYRIEMALSTLNGTTNILVFFLCTIAVTS